MIGGKGEQYWELTTSKRNVSSPWARRFSQCRRRGENRGRALLCERGLYAGVTLYQLWPVEVEDRPSTLVWRGDMISSEELAGLHGVERLGSESAMIKNISRAVRAVRSEIGGTR